MRDRQHMTRHPKRTDISIPLLRLMLSKGNAPSPCMHVGSLSISIRSLSKILHFETVWISVILYTVLVFNADFELCTET